MKLPGGDPATYSLHLLLHESSHCYEICKPCSVFPLVSADESSIIWNREGEEHANLAADSPVHEAWGSEESNLGILPCDFLADGGSALAFEF